MDARRVGIACLNPVMSRLQLVAEGILRHEKHAGTKIQHCGRGAILFPSQSANAILPVGSVSWAGMGEASFLATLVELQEPPELEQPEPRCRNCTLHTSTELCDAGRRAARGPLPLRAMPQASDAEGCGCVQQ